jgi:hypothetical protein
VEIGLTAEVWVGERHRSSFLAGTNHRVATLEQASIPRQGTDSTLVHDSLSFGGFHPGIGVEDYRRRCPAGPAVRVSWGQGTGVTKRPPGEA